ncbi:MFS general substrate transporter [Apiospora kogelbergensis]|uniref:MFS general substrate transporter n=1 Tax=Apiospora kogelbergensis TaxID=1337665 RepID=UPI003130BFC1
MSRISDAIELVPVNHCIAPQCVQNPKLNPYRDVVLRIAAASKEGPLRYCVLAVAANQLHSIGLVKYKEAMWLHRARALRLLCAQVAGLAHASSHTTCKEIIINEQIIASTLMLCFFEISQNCSRSWTIHADFARNFLRASLNSHESLSAEQQRIHRFAFAYFATHDVFAATAGSRLIQDQDMAELCYFTHESDILSLTGCTKKLIILISEISILCSLRETDGCSTSNDLTRRRNEAEQQLCQLSNILIDQPPAPTSSAITETHAIFEVKRQAALMYLYGRLDEAGPQETHMVKITNEILGLIQHISVRTNTLLWPLFIVAVMGIRTEDEENRTFLLEKLAALQESRQLGNVNKARRLIEDVWNARNLHPSQTWKGWSVLEGRYNAISLA